MSDSKVILHSYPASPFGKKVEWVLNYKKIPYSFVTIPMIAGRPLRAPLDGGYRKTPILQIGSDIYCDTHCIVRELEKRYPTPTLFPKTQSGSDITGIAWMMTAWSDTQLFSSVAGQIDFSKFPKEFLKDREAYRGGKVNPKFVEVDKDRIRAQLAWLEQQLTGKKWLLDTTEVSWADFNAAMPIWFMTTLKLKFLHEFPAVTKWFQGFMSIIPKTKYVKMTAEEALEIAKNTPIVIKQSTDNNEPNGLKPGDEVTVTPWDTGRVPVAGEIVSSCINCVTLRRKDTETGIETLIHFPRSAVHVVKTVSKL
ncbi:hypothetical protein INT43_008330 [Umbelopsis isabellina]|uniref:GST N-terminal domain-containing protein n=1 Tax=Mortierella isabellina TaxID=91625 RepID=A0A8H7PDD1_MORIS|nr:hypothetical protein INT43_008330 [Umbelopsis isabellina]